MNVDGYVHRSVVLVRCCIIYGTWYIYFVRYCVPGIILDFTLFNLWCFLRHTFCFHQ